MGVLRAGWKDSASQEREDRLTTGGAYEQYVNLDLERTNVKTVPKIFNSPLKRANAPPGGIRGTGMRDVNL